MSSESENRDNVAPATYPQPPEPPRDRQSVTPPEEDRERAEMLCDSYARLRTELQKIIVGQEEVVELLLTSLFAGGHSILIGVPGLAKTLLVSTLSRLLSLSFKRVQFTPDLMPSDITGTEVLQEDPKSGVRSFRFLKGPVFANLVLADEVNRATPKTQAALLEAMQERHVTVGEQTLPLPRPFFVIATQNPIEQEGTYNLPEAQLDRFLLAIQVRYPDAGDELEILKQTVEPDAVEVDQVLDAGNVIAIQNVVRRVPVAEHVYRFALELVRRTRPEDPSSPEYVREYLSWGAGPRAGKSLMHVGRARALLKGRFHVNTDDVVAAALPVLAHRLVTNFNADAEGVTPAEIVGRLLKDQAESGAAKR